MPMVEITTTPNAFDARQKAKLSRELSRIVLKYEAAPLDLSDNEQVQGLSWCFVNEQEVFVDGRTPTVPLIRVNVTLPEGVPGISGENGRVNREKIIKEATLAVLEVEGSEPTMANFHRVWVHIHIIRRGHWGGYARIISVGTLSALAVGPDEEIGDDIRAMREASISHFRDFV
jgi:phenylpyruvate tautomerase PptA (4-oxalocrotonate tautomerase family)